MHHHRDAQYYWRSRPRGREAELEAVGSECAPPLGGRIEAMRHAEDLRRMRNEAEGGMNSGKSAFGRNSGGNSAGRALGHGDLSWTGARVNARLSSCDMYPTLGEQTRLSQDEFLNVALVGTGYHLENAVNAYLRQHSARLRVEAKSILQVKIAP